MGGKKNARQDAAGGKTINGKTTETDYQKPVLFPKIIERWKKECHSFPKQ